MMWKDQMKWFDSLIYSFIDIHLTRAHHIFITMYKSNDFEWILRIVLCLLLGNSQSENFM